MNVIKEEGNRPIKMWVGMKIGDELVMPNGLMADGTTPDPDCLSPDIEDAALTQLKNIARLPFIHSNGVAAMPDVHMGIGASVGTVIATDKAIIPSAVGVDIGCGMNSIRLSLKASDLPESLKKIRDQIERDVPLGKGGASSKDINGSILGRLSSALNEGCGYKKWFCEIGDPSKLMQKAANQTGTLGSGNHFIELCIDENQDVWIMLHSGSRGIGNMIGSYFIEKAKKRMEQYFITLPDGDLAYFPEDTDDFNDYIEAVDWAQNYALNNRKVMMEIVVAALRKHIPTEFTITQEAINCHHNYVERENHFGRNLWVTRKGAIRARKDDLGIIPGSMGQKSYIVRGKGNLESYCSCSHGAGRKMSRTQARKQFTVEDLIAQTEGVECPKNDAVLDEIPSSYKNLDLVMANQTDLVEIVHTLKAILNVKGN